MKSSVKSTIKKKVANAKLAKRITITGVVVSSLMVVLGVVMAIFFNPKAVAQRELEALTRDYYENYYYDKLLAKADGADLNTVFDDFKDTGIAPAYLRQLLLFDNARHATSEAIFDNANYKCDKNKTSARIFPVAPYGKQDYTVEYTISCNNE